MPSRRTLSRLDALAWILIYGGLIALVLGIASREETVVGGWSLSVLGVASAIAGVILIIVRARLGEPRPDPSSTTDKDKETPA